MVLARIVSGGQSGADRAALDVAIVLGVAYGGWCPAGGWAEDFPEPPGLLAVYPGLHEAPSAEPALRTRLNVRDSDATLVVRGAERSAGTTLTEEAARQLGRPLLVTSGDVAEIRTWVRGLGPKAVLNVAGPRESEASGTYASTRALLEQALAPVSAPGLHRDEPERHPESGEQGPDGRPRAAGAGRGAEVAHAGQGQPPTAERHHQRDQQGNEASGGHQPNLPSGDAPAGEVDAQRGYRTR